MKTPWFVETFLRRRSALAGLAVGVGLAFGGGLASAQPAPGAGAGRDPVLVGSWFGERFSGDSGLVRWNIERREDGRYESSQFVMETYLLQQDATGKFYTPEPLLRTERGRWWSKGGVVYHAPEGDGPVSAYRYGAGADSCLWHETADPQSGTVARASRPFGECKPSLRRPLAAALKAECDLNEPVFQQSGAVVLRIETEADGQRHASYDGRREAAPVRVRDYPIRRAFDLRSGKGAGNAGEFVLATITQRAASPEMQLGARLGFSTADVRVTRMYLLVPPRPERPADHIRGSRSVLIEAFDGQDALLGTVLVSLPVIAACKPRP